MALLYPAFVYLLCLALTTPSKGQEEKPKVEYAPYDGFFNNLNVPNQGAIDSHLIRMSAAAYSDGVYEPAGPNRPNALFLSQKFHKGISGIPSERNRTAFMVFFGQQVVEEIMDAQRPGCPPEFLFVPIPQDYERYANVNLVGKAMPLLRTRHDQSTGLSPNNPRQQLNENTPYLDGSLFYGPAKAWADLIRKFEGGKLKENDTNPAVEASFPAKNTVRLPMANPPTPREATIFPVNRFFRLGNPRGNENPFLLTFGIIWFRWHNKVAENLQAQHSNWDDETLFLEARKRVVAHYQKIVMYDWLPAWLQLNETGGRFEIPAYKRYDRNVNPAIAQEFQTAAMRFGHTLVPTGVFKRRVVDGKCKFLNTTMRTGFPDRHGVRLCNAYWNSQEAVDEDMESLIMGMASQLAEKEDGIMVDDLNGQLFGPLEFTRRDLAALNIMRARDHGVPDYNTVREHYGLKRRTFDEIRPGDNATAARLRRIYAGKDDDIDLFVGGLLETTFDGPGELFREITLDQFLRIRDGDRFWYEDWESNRLFTEEEVEEINRITMRDIITNVTNIKREDLQEDLFVFKAGDPCPQPFQLGESSVEDCVEISRFDYFSGSEISFALSFLSLGLCLPMTVGILILLAKRRKKQAFNSRRKTLSGDPKVLKASEWVGVKSGERNVVIEFMTRRLKIHVMDSRRNSLRLLDLRNVKKIDILEALDGNQTLLQIKVPMESDLILNFGVASQRLAFITQLEEFLRSIGLNRDKLSTKEKNIYQSENTKEIRQKFLAKVVKVVVLQCFSKKSKSLELDDDSLNSVINVEITRSEFAEAMSLKPTSMFVRNMFKLLDKDNSGFLSFREFRDSFIIFATGDAESKTRMIFDMYDTKQLKYLSPKQFSQMISSMLELGDASLDATQVEQLTTSMLSNAGLEGKTRLVYEDFKKIFNDYEDTIGQATFALDGIETDTGPVGRGTDLKSRVRRTIIQNRNGGGKLDRKKRYTTVRLPASQRKEPDTAFQKKLHELTRYISNYRLQIFWVTLYSLVVAGIFIERAYYYSFNREHAGLRRIAGNGVTVTRGAASAMMFTYASLLVTMSRNTITFLRETFLHRFIPFDSAIAFHKFIAMVALLFTVVHCIGHGINFYHISTQRSPDLNCLFRDFFRPTHILAKFHYWLYQTITGFTGVVLTLIVIVMYVFATQYARRHVFKAFWFTHSFYVLLYIFMVLHGSGRLVQDPLFHYFFLGPAILFTLDKIASFSTKKIELSVMKAELLPSDVTHLEFKRPLNFDYRSGQWVRIACIELNGSEYHPFTLTSAPHEDTLSLHIRAVGPWTNNLRRTYDLNNRVDRTVPKLFVDGPFGEGHQDWYRYDVSVLIGGGIGVTPFASILKDIVFKSKTGTKLHCKKVYFLWITRTQKQFEWMTEIIREVEENDTNDLVSVHIFITQFFQKFDLRTTMLYICERHFQKVANKSLFTGLRSITHFGRPELQTFLDSLQEEHKMVKQFGVFSCGPPPMTHSVESACGALNKQVGATYVHHFENF